MEGLTLLQTTATVASLLTSGGIGLTVWGLKTGRWAQRVEDGSSASVKDIEALRMYGRELNQKIDHEHDVRRSVCENLAKQISESCTDVARLEERVGAGEKDRENIWRTIDRRNRSD